MCLCECACVCMCVCVVMRMYACGFRIYFTPLPGFFSPFPHGTCSLSVNDEYLALEDGPPIFRQDYTCPALLVVRSVPHPIFHIRGYHPLWPDFPDRSVKPNAKSYRLFRFRSPLLSESRLMSFPRATEIFQFPRSYRDWETDRKSTRLNSSHSAKSRMPSSA